MGGERHCHLEVRAARLGGRAAWRGAGLAGAGLVPRLGLRIGGYVPDFRPKFADERTLATPAFVGWEVRAWEVGLVDLINSLSPTAHEWVRHDPTLRIAPKPTPLHPIGIRRSWE